MSKSFRELSGIYHQIEQDVRREVHDDPAFNPGAIHRAFLDHEAGKRESRPLTVWDVANKRFRLEVGDDDAERYHAVHRAIDAARDGCRRTLYDLVQGPDILADVVRWELDLYATHGPAIFRQSHADQIASMGKKYATLYDAADRIPNRPPLPERHTDPVAGLQAMVAWCDDATAWKPAGHRKPAHRPAGGKKKTMRQPPKEAFMAYQIDLQLGWKQAAIAREMTRRLRKPVGQQAVSRWIKQVKLWLEAGNTTPEPAAPAVTAVDPSEIDRGQRTDHRTPRQRGKRRENA